MFNQTLHFMKNTNLTIILIMLLLISPLSGVAPMGMVDKFVMMPEKTEKKTSEELSLRVSYYHASANECDSTPTITASGAVIDTVNATELHWCAISWDLHKRYGGKFRFGDTLELTAMHGKHVLKGKYIVNDLMNPRWKKKVDILLTKGEKSITFDKVKVKHKKRLEERRKRKKRNKDMRVKKQRENILVKTLKENAVSTGKRLKTQLIYGGIIKGLGFVPYVGR